MDAAISISIVLFVMIVCTILKINLSITVFIGTIITTILFDYYNGILSTFATTITSFETINFLIIFYLVYILSGTLSSSELLSKMLLSLEKLIDNVWINITAIPLLIGLVPTPSGAIISAPFVKTIGEQYKLSSERMHVINYWFRHITEYLNPIYPGPIMIAAITGISFSTLFFLNIPIVVFVFLLGFTLFVMPIKPGQKKNKKSASRKDIASILIVILPILFAISLPILFNVNLSISLFITIILFYTAKHKAIKNPLKILKNSFKGDLLLLVFFVMLFKGVLRDSGAIESFSQSLISSGIPPILIIIIIPSIVGFMTGMTFAPVSIVFPIILPFLSADAGINLGLLMVSFVSTFLAILISPIHLCFSVTQKYFNAPYNKIYQLITPVISAVFVFSLILMYIGWPPF